MPRWKALPDELDPQIREFTSQLRRLVDRSGLNVAAVADRTGYSKTSWERYLNGRLLAPKGAIVALAEVTGTNPVHLTTMWELAERAWSRSEMRHDMTMEAIRISQARAALSEFGAQPGKAKGRSARRNDGPGSSGSSGPSGPSGPAVTPGIAGPAGVSPTVPQRPSGPSGPAGQAGRTGQAGQAGPSGPAGTSGPQRTSSSGPEQPSGSSGSSSDGPEDAVNSWRLAGYQGPSRTGVRGPGSGVREGRPEGAATPPSGSPLAGTGMGMGAGAGAGAYGEPSRGGRHGSGSGGGKRRVTMFLAGVVGVLVVVAGAFYLTRGGDTADEGTEPKPSPTVTASVELPPGVECSGASCVGKDAEAMGCSGDLVTTTASAVVGTTTVEVRYSKTCQAAWGRITLGTTGDAVDISAGGAEQIGTITEAGDTIAYTPMVAVEDAEKAVACATLATGETGCTQ
ncbi:DUF2690 domain-containing protein [Streptomyces sp. NPDC004610]|uniref:DUF2690 domain-containing protein n=1 Tax=unclassified Streptomyces TaxID=2593676 RepID=UPI0033B4CCF0